MADTSLVTVLFTDIVSSTALTQSLGETAFEELRREHFRLLRTAIDAHRGEEVKTAGDGFMVAFANPSDAIACAVHMQQAVHRHNLRKGHDVGLRVGIHLGEATFDEGDYYGTPVVVAERLCKIASGGQIVTSDALRVIIGARGHSFARIGEVDLKGIDEPVAACEVRWEPSGIGPLPLPPAIAIEQPTPFVGRADEMGRLRQLWESARQGRRQVVLVSGEPGMGKTRLAREFSLAVHDEGASVLFGRCDEEALLPYQPFVEALRYYAEACPPDELRAQLDGSGGALLPLVPELAARFPDLPPAPKADPESERYLLFEAVCDLLIAGTGLAPIVLVVDDLHWADKPTLLLLRHLLRRPEQAALAVVATYRETELARTHPLAEALADLRRDHTFERLQLRGLDEDDIDALLAALAQHDVGGRGRALARALEQTTEGNPFFVQEIVRHLVETERIFQRDGLWTFDVDVDQLGIPEGVKEVIGRRLSRLSEEANVALAHAAVLGRAFEFEVLRRMVDLPEDKLLFGLEEALAGQLLAEAPGTADPAYAFSHALVRQTLYEEMSIPRRQRLHLRAAETIESVHERDLESRVVELAVHYRTSGAAAPPAKSTDYSIRAGEAARAAFAYEEADAHWRAALEVMEEHSADPLSRARLLERLGDLMYVSHLDYAKGVEDLERALALYEEAGEEERAAQMHSRLGRDLSTRVGLQDFPRAHEHFRAAEAVLRKGPERASLGYVYAGMASVALSQAQTSEGFEASSRAMQIGERLGNEGLWANAATLHAWHLISTGRPNEGTALFERAWETSDRLNAVFPAFLGAWLGGLSLSHQLSDPVAAERWLERELAKPRLAQAPVQRRFLTGLLGGAHVTAGRVDAARAAFAISRAQRRTLFFLDGAWEEDIEALRSERDTLRQTGERWNQAGRMEAMALCYEALGEAARAEECLHDALAIVGGQVAPNELSVRSRLAILSALGGRSAEAQAHLETCRDLMSPDQDWRGRTGVVAAAAAIVSTAAGDLEGAYARFEEATSVFRRYHLRVFEADALHRWGRALRAVGHESTADEKFDAAVVLYRQLEAHDRVLELVNSHRRSA